MLDDHQRIEQESGSAEIPVELVFAPYLGLSFLPHKQTSVPKWVLSEPKSRS